MKAFFALLRRELFAYFVTPLAYVLLFAFTLWQGLHFYLLVQSFVHTPEASLDQGPIQAFFGGDVFYHLPLLVLCPALTMRLFAEERQRGTLETLLTAPISATSIVAAKFLAALFCYMTLWIPTLAYVVILRHAADVDLRVVASSYLGVLVLSAPYLALGTLASALARSQLVAMVLAAAVVLGLFLLGLGEYVLDEGPARTLCSYVSLWTQMGELSRGIIDSRRLVFDGTLVALPLFLTVRIVDSWRTA